MDAERFSLAELVDWLALPNGPRDRALVLRTAEWLHQNRGTLQVEICQLAGLTDAVATLQMQDDVSLVVTGRSATLPGDWTCKVNARHFPDVHFQRQPQPVAEPVEFAAVDYLPAGRRALLPTGDRAVVLAAVLAEGEQKLRVRLASGQAAVFARQDVVLEGD